MDEAGVERPSRTLRERNREPSGVSVKPGTYKAVLEYLDQVSENQITVATDPRLDVSQKAINDVYTMGKKLENLTQAAASAVKQLVESKETVEGYNKRLSKLDKEKYKDSISLGKAVIKQIDSLVADYLGREDDRQGITRNPEVTVMNRINTASWYAQSRPAGMTATENRLYVQAQNALEKALQRTNAFFAKEWPEYREKVEALELSPFSETKVITLEN